MTIQFNDPDDYTFEVRGLVRLLDGVLERVVNGYAQAGVALPERRYWTLSEPSADCPQLTVSFVQAYYGPPGDEAASPSRCEGPRSAAIDIQILREIPVVGSRSGKAPSGEAIQRHSEQLAIDAWLLLDIARDLDLWDQSGPGLGIIATVDAGSPQGGYQGSTLHLVTAIP